MDIIYYHGGCPDGWCAAYIAHLKYPEAQLIPLSYGSVDYGRMIEEVRGKNVLMLDFSLKTTAENNGVYYTAESFHIYDHHKSARAIIGDKSYATFDMDRSGAGLTWDYLFGKDSGKTGKDCDTHDYSPPLESGICTCIPTRPWWVNYTEDQDLWRFKLPASRQINAWLNVQERTVEHWAEVTRADRDVADVARLGYAIQLHIDYLVKHAMKDLQEGVWQFEGRNYRVGVVNNGHIGTSEVGEAIYTAGYDVAIMWREDGEGMTRFGLRSNTADVGAMASSFPGGGGHKASSGFELSIEKGRAFLDMILGRGQYEPTSRCC